jgi:Insertion element 4 transposase N-terminal
MARVGQQIAGLGEDRLPGRVAVGVLTKVFPTSLVDEVVAAAGVREQRVRVLPARLVVYYNLAMIMFFQSSYSQVWTKLVGGLDWGKSFRMRLAVGMSPSPAAISMARSRLGWQVMADLLDRVAGPLAGQEDGWAHVAGLRLVAFDGLTIDVPDTTKNAAEFGRLVAAAGRGRSRRCGSWRWPSVGPGL